jgi:flagellar assembly protein FliH
LALQPAQLLTLVDETLAAMPPVREGVEVYMNPRELQRILEVDPERASRWSLIPDSRLEPGECRINADGHEADAGCRQRLAACIDQVRAQLLDESEEPADMASVRQAA